jgi:hypothetical protein
MLIAARTYTGTGSGFQNFILGYFVKGPASPFSSAPDPKRGAFCRMSVKNSWFGELRACHRRALELSPSRRQEIPTALLLE